MHKPIQTSSPKEKEAVQQEDNACNIEERLTLNLQKDLLNKYVNKCVLGIVVIKH